MESLIMIGFLMAYIVFSEIRNYYERKGLLDRIMSKDYSEYVSGEISTEQARHKKIQKPDDLINL